MRPEHHNPYNIPDHPVTPQQEDVLYAQAQAEELGAELYGFWLHMKNHGKGLGGLDFSPVFKRNQDGQEVYFWRARIKGDYYEERAINLEEQRQQERLLTVPEYLSH